MSYVSIALRRLVTTRANNRCEYCLFPAEAIFFSFEMEHIVAEKQGGLTSEDNLALACPPCNRAKGTDLGSIDSITHLLTAFFNPRTESWHEHFSLSGFEIEPLTPEGRVTERILQFNTPARLAERDTLIQSGYSFQNK